MYVVTTPDKWMKIVAFAKDSFSIRSTPRVLLREKYSDCKTTRSAGNNREEANVSIFCQIIIDVFIDGCKQVNCDVIIYLIQFEKKK